MAAAKSIGMPASPARRAFLATSVTSACLMPAAVTLHADDPPADIIVPHVTKELVRLHRRTVHRRRRPSGDDLQAVAGHLRLLSAHPHLSLFQRRLQRQTPADLATAALDLPTVLTPYLPPDVVADAITFTDDAPYAIRSTVADHLRSDPAAFLTLLAQKLEDVAPTSGVPPPTNPAMYLPAAYLPRLVQDPTYLYGCMWMRTFQYSLYGAAAMLTLFTLGAAGPFAAVLGFTGFFFQMVAMLSNCPGNIF